MFKFWGAPSWSQTKRRTARALQGARCGNRAAPRISASMNRASLRESCSSRAPADWPGLNEVRLPLACTRTEISNALLAGESRKQLWRRGPYARGVAITRDELEAGLLANWDPAQLAVYGDFLQSEGDPRGELIAIDFAGGLTPERDVRRSEPLTALVGSTATCLTTTDPHARVHRVSCIDLAGRLICVQRGRQGPPKNGRIRHVPILDGAARAAAARAQAWRQRACVPGRAWSGSRRRR